MERLMINCNEVVSIDGSDYFQHQYFHAISGHPDRCANCNNDVMAHNNGRCPVNDRD